MDCLREVVVFTLVSGGVLFIFVSVLGQWVDDKIARSLFVDRECKENLYAFERDFLTYSKSNEATLERYNDRIWELEQRAKRGSRK